MLNYSSICGTTRQISGSDDHQAHFQVNELKKRILSGMSFKYGIEMYRVWKFKWSLQVSKLTWTDHPIFVVYSQAVPSSTGLLEIITRRPEDFKDWKGKGGLRRRKIWHKVDIIWPYLVGAITILKNDGVRQWEGWNPIYYGKNVWNHQPDIIFSENISAIKWPLQCRRR